jgi:chemotaxis protein MotD
MTAIDAAALMPQLNKFGRSERTSPSDPDAGPRGFGKALDEAGSRREPGTSRTQRSTGDEASGEENTDDRSYSAIAALRLENAGVDWSAVRAIRSEPGAGEEPAEPANDLAEEAMPELAEAAVLVARIAADDAAGDRTASASAATVRPDVAAEASRTAAAARMSDGAQRGEVRPAIIGQDADEAPALLKRGADTIAATRAALTAGEQQPARPVAGTFASGDPQQIAGAGAGPERGAGAQSPVSPQTQSMANTAGPEFDAQPGAKPLAAAERAANQASRITSPGPGQQPLPERVTVLSAQSTPAPAMMLAQLGPTAQSVVAPIAAEPAFRPQGAGEITQLYRPGTQATQSLRIQLNPAELGMVTARLIATGQQLSIELRVDNSEAWQRLASESDSIVKALRAAGLDVERVTIQQGTGNATTGQGAGAGRDGGAGQPLAEGRDEERGSGNGGRGNGEGEARRQQAEDHAHRTQGGLYI